MHWTRIGTNLVMNMLETRQMSELTVKEKRARSSLYFFAILQSLEHSVNDHFPE